MKESAREPVLTNKHAAPTEENSHLPNYNLDLLAHFELPNIWKRFNIWITTSVAYVSLAVILIYTAKLFLWTGLMFNAVIREGSEVAATVLYATCCGALYKWGRILRSKEKWTLRLPTENPTELQTLA